jgi:predicted GIY-YIG superfamily endonuclease
MKIASIGRRNKPNCLVLRLMQSYSTRGWVYREGQGWIFADLTPDELAEFKSYQCGITIPRMRVRLPYSQVIRFTNGHTDYLVNWFAYCTMQQAHPLALRRFQINQMTDGEPRYHVRYPVDPGSYEAWLWADEVKICRGLGCEVTIHHGFGWREWGVPSEWKRSQYKEHTFIYALVDELAQEVRYVGKADDPERRLLEHLKDTKNPAKWTWIQSLAVQNRKPKLIILEEVALEEAAVAVESEREDYWISYYWKRGHNLTNDICQYWHKPDEE